MDNATEAQSASTPTETKPEKGLRIVTLDALGASLPLGTVDIATGATNKAIERRPWTLRTEKKLAKMRDDQKNTTVAQFAAMVVGQLYTRLGAFEISDETLEKKWNSVLLQVSDMWLGDVMYAYILLRCTCLGYDFEYDVSCPRCGRKQRAKSDLRGLTVKVAASLKDASWTYRLKEPLKVRGQIIEELQLGPCRWRAVEAAMADGAIDMANAKSAMILSSIQTISGLNSPLAEAELDELSKVDIEHLTNEIDSKNVGPDLAVEIECARRGCREEFKRSINWMYDSFFAVSSR